MASFVELLLVIGPQSANGEEMLKVLGAFVAVVAAILMKGLLNLAFTEILLTLAVPLIFLYKCLGNRPAFLVYVGFAAGFFGGLAFVFGYIVVPIQYYYAVWGWPGVVGGVIATILLPFQLVLFFAVAFFKGGAAVYIGKFISGVLFAIAGGLLFASCFSASPWARFQRKRAGDVGA